MWLSRLPVGSSARMSARLRDERPGDRDPLLLAAGELGGLVVEAVAEAHPLERRRARGEPLLLAARPGRAAGVATFSSADVRGSRL